jgi:uncharacterized protein (DUF2147 family)
MRRAFVAALALAGLAVSATAAPAAVFGVWATEKHDAHIELHGCGGLVCGRIVWVKTPTKANGEPERDDNNPDPALRQRPILGLPLIWGLAPVAGAPGRYEGGKVYNPEDGRTYGAEITLLGDGRLRMRGYFGIPLLGGSEIWTRVR